MEARGKGKALAIGFYVGKKYFEKYTTGDPHPQVAAFKLESRFYDAIEASGMNVDVVSTVAASTFPKVRKLYFPGLKFNEGRRLISIVPFINFPLMKFFSRSVSIFFGMMNTKKKYDFIVVYSVHLPNLIPAYLCSVIYRIPFLVYVPDLPGQMVEHVRGWAGTIRTVNSLLCNRIVAASAGLFVVTKYMVTDSAGWRHLPYLVVEGIADGAAKIGKNASVIDNEKKKIFMYAGAVSKRYGVSELVEGFLQADMHAELWICGRGDLEKYLIDLTITCPRVKYFGFLPMDEVARLQSKATCMVITRNPKDHYTRYSFPSKVLEYMMSGKPVMTTFLDGIPAPYFEYFHEIKSFSVGDIKDAFLTFDGDCVSFTHRAELARSWVLANKTPQVVGNKIKSFLEKCLG